jgi:addiction module HigA family antidote
MPSPHPGELLKTRFLDPLGLSAYQVAQAVGVHVSRISLILRGERSLSPDTAARLGHYFGVPAKWFLEMQLRYDLDRTNVSADQVVPLQRPPGTAIGPKGVRRFRSAAPAAQQKSTVSDALIARLEAQARASNNGPAESQNTSVEALPGGYRVLTGAD